MKFNSPQKIISKLFFCFIVLFFTNCTSQNSSTNNENEDNNELVDSINNLDEAIDVQEVRDSETVDSEKNILEAELIKRADSLYFADNFEQAETLYDMALNTVTDEATKKSLMEKIVRTKEKVEITSENSTKDGSTSILGTHTFGVQFIYDHYGKAEITPTKNVDRLFIKGEQRHKSEYVTLEGILNAENPNVLLFEGSIQIFTDGCCGKIEKVGKYTFKRHKGRKFWRLQEFNSFCDQYTCAYYLDIFE